MFERSRRLLTIACGLAAAPAGAQIPAASQYRIEALTTQETQLHNGSLRSGVAMRLLSLSLAPVRAATTMAYQHRMPAEVTGAAPITLPVRAVSQIDLDATRSHPFERPFKRVLIYWGCGETVAKGQPKVITVRQDSDERLAARLAPSPGLRPGPARVEELPLGERLIASRNIQLPQNLRMRGEHELTRGDEVVQFDIEQTGEFLEPLEISQVSISEAGAVRLRWQRQSSASAYFANLFIHPKRGPDVVIWTSSRVAEAGWLLTDTHPGAAGIEKLLGNGVLMGREIETCTVPPAVTQHAPGSMVVQVHAFAPEIEARPRPDSRPTGLQIRIAPRVTASVFVQSEERAKATATAAAAPRRTQLAR